MATDNDQSHWNLKYEQGLPSLTKPDPFFLSAFSQFAEDQCPHAGVALDLAGGLGRHALWLASRRWQVTVVDISEVAIHKLRQRALQLALTLNLFVLDAAEYVFEPSHFDLIMLFYHVNRELCPKIVASLKPGGILICKSSIRWSFEDENPLLFAACSLGRDEISSLFSELQTLYHLERPVRDRGVAEYVGRKSESSS